MNPNIRRSATRRPEQYQIADLLVDVGQQRVRRADVEIPIPKLSFDLFLALIRAAPNVVSNDELMTQVWPRVVVSPETISQRVKLLRDALGDDARAPQYIARVRSRGYRLIPERRSIARESENVSARLHSQSNATPGTISLVGLPPRTVAVLPFENFSPDPANEYLAHGMAEMVLNRLASLRGITVIARSSSFTCRDGAADARDIGHKLGARYLVEGSVQREGEKLRVTASLIDAESGSQLEALRFDRTIADIFSIEDQIADTVADALASNLANLATTVQSSARSDNLDAWLAYLQGRELLERWTVGGFQQAVQQFDRAITLDPGFAAAYVALADAHMLGCWTRQVVGNRVGGKEEGLQASLAEKIAPLVNKALALDPFLGAAYLVRGQWMQDDPHRAEADYRKGIELDPANGRGLVKLCEFLMETDRHEEARRVLDRALLVDPLSARAHYIKAMHFTGDPQAFEQGLLDALRIDPNLTSALRRLGQVRWAMRGEFAEGVKLVERAIGIEPEQPSIGHTAYLMYVDMGDLAAARDVSAPLAERAGNVCFQILQYIGHWREAGEAVYGLPDWLRGYYSSNANDAEAIRDLALRTRDYDRAIRFIEREYDLGEPRELSARSADRAVPLAQLLRENGQIEDSFRLLEKTLTWLDAGEWKPGWAPAMGRILANALALRDERDAALRELAAAFRSGERGLWWYTIDRDSLWDSMRSDPRFQEIAAEARAHAAGQRTLLEEMRRQGEVPFRPGCAEVRASPAASTPADAQ
jgi:TolB-like protein